MAVVYRADDVRHGREVAIKVLPPDLAASLATERFLREIGTAAKLNHPHIVPLFDSGVADGLLYYVMPLVPGESLRARLDREKQLPTDDAIAIVRDIAEALAHAHRQGIVHRDIKPENILLNEGHALLADFGVARAVARAGNQALTGTGWAIGTPSYMSPEQAFGQADVDLRTDIYSLACTLYEMLTGEPPFAGTTLERALAERLSVQPALLDRKRPGLPRGLSTAISKALASKPFDRYDSATEFVAALENSGMARTRRWPRVAAAGAIVAAVAVAIWWVAANSPRPVRASPSAVRDPATVAVLDLDDASPDGRLRAIGAGISSELSQILRTSPELTVLAEEAVLAVSQTAAEPLAIARELNAGTLLLGTIAASSGELSVTLRLVDGNSSAVLDSVTRTSSQARLFALGAVLAEQVQQMLVARMGQQVPLASTTGFGSTGQIDAWILVQDGMFQMRQAVAPGDPLAMVRFGRADSLFARAEALDPRWIEPPRLRALTAYRRSRLSINEPGAADLWSRRGLEHITRALALDSLDAAAREVRGNLRYWRYLINLERGTEARLALITKAREDLETAVRRNPSQAGAWSTLSHLYYQREAGANTSKVSEAAARAYQINPFLPNARTLLMRVFFAAYDANRPGEAARWCAEGSRRFAAAREFLECQLLMLTMPSVPPDAGRSWRLFDSTLAASTAEEREYRRRFSQLMVAVVLARTGLRDSAAATIRRALLEVDTADRELASAAAFAYLSAGDTAKAVEQARRYLAGPPPLPVEVLRGWWHSGLADHPGVRGQTALQSR